MESDTAAINTRSALSERSIKDAKPGDVLWDAGVKGLHLRCFPDSKQFYLYFRTKARRERRPKLGVYGSITLTQARAVAQEMLAQVAAGRDPQAERQAQREERTVEQLWFEYWHRHAIHKKSKEDDDSLWRTRLQKPLGRFRLSEVTYAKVADLIAAIGSEAPIRANRALSLLSKMWSFAHRPLQWTDQNPCKGVRRFKENKRKRYMTSEEAGRICAILDAQPAGNLPSVAFIKLLMFTGARSGEIAAARWDWLDGAVLRLPDSKTGAKAVHLAPPAMAVLGSLPRTTGKILGIQSPKKLWEKITTQAGCPDLRLHDLRHSFASAGISAGLSLAQVGELLGHANTQTTHRYAHLVEEAAAEAAALAAGRMAAPFKS